MATEPTPQVIMANQQKQYQGQYQYIDSEHYRQMLVRDGDRRFREWHHAFLKYQQQFLQHQDKADQH